MSLIVYSSPVDPWAAGWGKPCLLKAANVVRLSVGHGHACHCLSYPKSSFYFFTKGAEMFTRFQNPLSLIGRLLLAYLFLPAGIGKIMHFAGTVGYVTSGGLPMPQVAAALAIVIEIGGGLALIAGYCTRWAALVLALFTLIASCVFHAYWAVPPEAQMVTQLLFNKNVAVIGGLLTLAAWGAGAWSMDARREKKE